MQINYNSMFFSRFFWIFLF